jgi:hypothetical protein
MRECREHRKRNPRSGTGRKPRRASHSGFENSCAPPENPLPVVLCVVFTLARTHPGCRTSERSAMTSPCLGAFPPKTWPQAKSLRLFLCLRPSQESER